MAVALVTADQLLQAATGIDWATVAEDASVSDPRQLIEQGNIILRASAFAANFCGMPTGLHATSQTEIHRTRRSVGPNARVWVDQDGFLNFRTSTGPILSVTSSQYASLGSLPLVWTSEPAANWQIEGVYPQVFRLIDFSQNWAFARQNPTNVSVTYVSGWGNATIAAAVTAGTNKNIQVDTSLGFSVGDTAWIYDAALTEQVTVIAVPDATHVTVSSLVNGHGVGVGFSEVPSDIQEAVFLTCIWMVKEPRGAEALEMRGSGREHSAGPATGGDELAEAEYLLEPFARRW